MKKIVLVIFGTRPEAIKMAPIVMALKESDSFQVVSCATAQHRDLLDQVLGFFSLVPDFDLNLMKANQDLFDVTISCLTALRQLYQVIKPDMVLVQGDTTTTYAAALCAFYQKIPVGHVEAGLRTGEKYAPFPEEINRRMVTPLADLHFAPTDEAANNLIRENVPEETIHETGNTSIDALLWASEKCLYHEKLSSLYAGKKLVLLTAHRRENFGVPLREIFETVRQFAISRNDIHFVYPVHPNPNVKPLANSMLGNLDNVSLIEPVSYGELIFLLKGCSFILTDSGGLQEEAPALGKPVLVLRESTERPEAVDAGCANLVGHNRDKIWDGLCRLSDESSTLYYSMSHAGCPYGDGTASQKIVSIMEDYFMPRRHMMFVPKEFIPRPYHSMGRPSAKLQRPKFLHHTLKPNVSSIGETPALEMV